jgi:hypothetical protein
MSEASPAALLALRAAAQRLNVDLAALVAAVALWAPRSAHRRHVSDSNPTGAVYPHVRRARRGAGEKPGLRPDGIRLDSNNYAGGALRTAIGLPKEAITGYEACHIWPDTCYDLRYHTVLANLVLVPAPLASLTDHAPDVMAALQYRAFDLYRFHPTEVPPPPCPVHYPAQWNDPVEPPARR